MKVTYLRLENVEGLRVGSNRTFIEIDFSKARNKIVCIVGPNGFGKSVLISSIHPFSGVTSVDDRSSLSYITKHKDGYKEIHYDSNGDKIVIKHYYRAVKETHSVKSYFSLNGEELNPNGNVRSFLALVESHFGLTEEMMRLIRLGTNVNSFITLPPARRKEYIAKLMEEIDSYLIIHKNINDDFKVVKTLISNNNANIYKCHISDIVIEEDKLSALNKEINKQEREKEKIISDIGKLQALISKNDIDEVRRKKHELETRLSEIKDIETSISKLSLQNTSVDQLMKKRSNLSDEKIAVQSKIDSYRISIDNGLRQIERLEVTIKRITSNNDIKSLMSSISTLKDEINNVNNFIKEFRYLGSSVTEIQYLVSKLISFNQISQMIYTFGTRPIEVYIKLKAQNKSVDKFLKDQSKKAMSRLNDMDIKNLLDRVFGSDAIITPNCIDEFKECPYYRLSEAIYEVRDKLEEESFDDETLRAIQIISNNIDNILNELDNMRNVKIPDKLKDQFKEEYLLNRLHDRVPFFDIEIFQEYLSILKEYELYQQNIKKLQEYEYQLSIYKKSGIDNQLSEINVIKESITFYRTNIDTLSKDIIRINGDLSMIDESISLVSKYNEGKKNKSIFESSLEATDKILGPLQTATNEKAELEFSLRQVTNLINLTRMNHKELEMKINEYKRLMKESEELSEQYDDLSLILKVVSTKQGIPIIMMKKYLGRIKKSSNNLLDIIYDGNFRLSKFHIDEDRFEVPYVKNGIKVSDLRYASQSEIALGSMALSFALANKASNIYNILLLDEIDAGLDEINRPLFLKMLYQQMVELNAEQVFVISHNMTQMVNIPMDCIQLGETSISSKYQNIIYK